jgi:orotate phosphoribosyltransferase
MSTARQQLLRMLVEKSFRTGTFTLSSGAQSDYYIDCRATTLDAEGARLTGRAVLDEIMARRWKADGIGGLTLGADPIVVAVAVLSSEQKTPIHGFLIRKQEKQHGTGQRIEGFQKRGAKVVIVDDVCTTGDSTMQAIETARRSGMEVIGVICLVDRQEQNGRANVEKAAAPAQFVALFTTSDLREAHKT